MPPSISHEADQKKILASIPARTNRYKIIQNNHSIMTVVEFFSEADEIQLIFTYK